MLNTSFFLAVVCLISFCFSALSADADHPKYLFKVLSDENWKASQGMESLKLSNEDQEFIHLATEDQLGRIVQKYWADVAQFIVLKINAEKLSGRLVYEANPGGSNKYYHLYNGSIPLSSIVESKTF